MRELRSDFERNVVPQRGSGSCEFFYLFPQLHEPLLTPFRLLEIVAEPKFVLRMLRRFVRLYGDRRHKKRLQYGRGIAVSPKNKATCDALSQVATSGGGGNWALVRRRHNRFCGKRLQ